MKRWLPILFMAVICGGTEARIATPQVKADLAKRQSEWNLPGYFKIFERELSPAQRECLEVLYAYLPLPDITDRDGDYFLQNVDYTLMARKEMPWGRTVPDKEFRHFVLPVRVNNEALDAHRAVFYNELKDRIKHLSMYDAILEVNHWCHEKATYQPSDARTHSPLCTVESAIGRCGEESTFLVAALRAVGIPARQVYTPRWAHTDDNHAWVEAWADGEWYFLGACEPEAVLNLGWFNAPAKRGMLMNTRVFGNYEGEEEVLLRIPGYTDINVTHHYAPVDTLRVLVTDADGAAVPEAEVRFCLYNYAEYYPLAVKQTDEDGRASLISGLGDLIVWASHNGRFGFMQATTGKDRTVTVPLSFTASSQQDFEFNLNPPAPSAAMVRVNPEKAALNERRKAFEDSLRRAYTSTFITREQAAELASTLNVNADTLTVIFTDARGHHNVIKEFLETTPLPDRPRALQLLMSLSAKDRSDINPAVLEEQMQLKIFEPRVDVENLTPFSREFLSSLPKKKQRDFRDNPMLWVQFVKENIDASFSWQPASVIMSPLSVMKARKTNRLSRNVFFVRGARALGIEARIDAVSGKTQLYLDGEWKDIDLDGTSANHASPSAQTPPSGKGRLQLSYTPALPLSDPKYYYQFTLSKTENGMPQLLNYPDECPWSEYFKEPVTLEAGQYILTTGQRLASGGVLAHSQIFTLEPGLEPGSLTTVPLTIRQSQQEVQVIGSFNSENLYYDLNTETDKSLLSTTGRGYYILGLLKPNHEPTNHTLRDIAAPAPAFDSIGTSIVLLFADKDEYNRLDKSRLPELPSTVRFGTDINRTIANELTESLHLTSVDAGSPDLPVFIIADTFNRVVYVSQGYTIGLGERLLEILHRIP